MPDTAKTTASYDVVIVGAGFFWSLHAPPACAPRA